MAWPGSSRATSYERGRALVADDDLDVRGLVAAALESAGFEVDIAADGVEAIRLFERDAPDIVVLDVVMPGMTGLNVLERIRQQGGTPVVMLSSMDDEDTKVRGFRLGADDFVGKPFSTRELMARVDAVLRRAGDRREGSGVLAFGADELVLDARRREVVVRGESIETTAREFDLLFHLASAPGRVFTRQELLRDVWRSSEDWQQPGTVTEHVRRLRRKIEVDPNRPRWLVTIRSVGYRFTDPRPEAPR
jgi:DNA-binding response OmpR family regulator